MPKKILIYSVLLCLAVNMNAQRMAIKHNFLYDAFLTPNVALEFAVSPKITIDNQFGINSFFYSKEMKKGKKQFAHFLLESEVRYWQCEAFNGLFYGAHILGGAYRLSGYRIPMVLGAPKDMANYFYQGYFIGAGLSIGYSWVLHPRINIQTSVGLGYVRIFNKTKIDNAECTNKNYGSGGANYIGPTKGGVSIVFLLF